MFPRPLHPSQPSLKRKERIKGREGGKNIGRGRGRGRGRGNGPQKKSFTRAHKFAFYRSILAGNILQKNPKIIEHIFPLKRLVLVV